MDIGLPRRDPEPPDTVSSPYTVWVRDALEVVYDQVRRHSGQAVQCQKRLYMCLLPPHGRAYVIYINITYIQLQSRTYIQLCIQELHITGICESLFIHSMNIVANSTVNT